jgi:hypothetical protein
MNVKKFTKDFKEFPLKNGWKLMMHKEYEIYKRQDKYAIIDAKDDVLLKFYLESPDVIREKENSVVAVFFFYG